MKQEAPKVSIIGYGGMAQYHAERMRKSGLMQVVGTFDIDEARQEASRAAGYIAYPTAEALLADKASDVVLIATPNDRHCPYTVAAAEAGKNVICEKPAALSVDELDRMAKAAQDHHVIFSVHQNRRWDADFVAARQIMESGVLGRIYRIDSFVCGANGIPGGWRKTVAAGGGMMLDWGVHLIDQILYALPQNPVSLYCKYSKALGFDVDDGFELQLGFPEDLTVHIRVDTNTFVQMPRWILYGRDGTAIIRDWDVNGSILLPVYGSQVEIVGIEAGNGFTKTMAYRPHESVDERPVVRPQVDCDAFYKNFAAAVRGKEKPCVTVESVRKVLRIMELCRISDAENRVVKDELKE